MLQRDEQRAGAPDKTVNSLGPGTTFGQFGVLGSQPRAATVATITACELLSLHAYDYCRLIDEGTMAEMKAVAAKYREMSQNDVANDTVIMAALQGRKMDEKDAKVKSKSIKVIKKDKGAGRAAARQKFEDSGLDRWDQSPRSGSNAKGNQLMPSNCTQTARGEASFLPAIKPNRGYNTAR